MTTVNPTFTDQLEAIVRATAGVETVYPAAPLLKTATLSIVAAAAPNRIISPHIVITEHEGIHVATIHIGVVDTLPAPQTARDVLAAVNTYLQSNGVEDMIIKVRIGRIG